MTFAISRLDHIFPLCANMQNYHLKYPNVVHEMSCNVNKIPLKRVTNVDEYSHNSNLTDVTLSDL